MQLIYKFLVTETWTVRLQLWVSFLSPLCIFCRLLQLIYCQYQCNWLPGKNRLWNDLSNGIFFTNSTIVCRKLFITYILSNFAWWLYDLYVLRCCQYLMYTVVMLNRSLKQPLDLSELLQIGYLWIWYVYTHGSRVWMNEWKCNDLKCVRKPTKSRLSLTHHANKSSRWAE